MTAQEFADSAAGFFHAGAVYYVIQLVRCVLISFAVFAGVMVLRKTILKHRVFLKGALWSLFIPVLFAGKMKFFDETRAGFTLFSPWTELCMKHGWICWLYLCGVFLYAAFLFYRRRKLKKWIVGMEKRKVDDSSVYVTKMPVTPSTIGVFRPKIIVPEVMLEEYSREEIQLILLHEKTHIRLGHLVCYLCWDILRALLWLNPLLTIGTKYFREDMEEICDRITIQRSREQAYIYGILLIKSMKLLQAENKGFNMFATFTGDKQYQNIRQRMTRIAGYKPYSRTAAVGIALAVLLCVAGAVVWIQNISYSRYNEYEEILVYQYDGDYALVGDMLLLEEDNSLQQVISYDDRYVYVDRKAFDSFLQRNNAEGEIHIVFGGFYKLPGIGGAGYDCYYEPGSENKTVKIPYEKTNDWRVVLFKML